MKYLLLLIAFLVGCVSPAVDIRKEIFVVGNPYCTKRCTSGSITVNMNSGTDIEAQVEQKTKLDTAVSGLP